MLRIEKTGEKHGKSNRFGGLVPLSYDDTLAKETRPFYVCTGCRCKRSEEIYSASSSVWILSLFLDLLHVFCLYDKLK